MFTRVASRVPMDGEEKPFLDQTKSWIEKKRRRSKEETADWTWLDYGAYLIPAVGWLRTYKIKEYLLWDIIAGLSVGAMVVPQGMSYANLAGLPYVYGLYGAFVPCLFYAVLGSSKQLAVGPVAVTSMLLASGLADLFDGNVNDDPNNPTDPALQTEYNKAAIQVAFLAGIFYTAVGVLRMGWLTNFLSHSVISGFTTGAAVIIGCSQVKYLFGLHDMGRTENLIVFFEQFAEYIHEFSWREFLMGMSFLLILVVFKYCGQHYKKLNFMRAIGPLTVCILSIAIMNIFKLYEEPNTTNPYIKPVGTIPSGLPSVTVSWWFPLKSAGRQIVLALLICVIDIVESISIAKLLAAKNKYQLNATQELRGLGLANIAGAVFNCYTTTGSFSRSAVNNNVGAKTPLAGFVTGLLVMLVLLVLTGVFTNMSRNVQGAIIVSSVIGLFDWQKGAELWKVNKFDFLIFIVAALVTMLAGVEIGLGVSVGLSLIIVIYKTAFPRITTIGRIPDTTIYRSRNLYPDAEIIPGIMMLRIDAPLFFANIEGVSDHIREKLARIRRQNADATKPDIKFVIIDMSPVTDLDATALHFLGDLVEELHAENVGLALANPGKRELEGLRRSGLLEMDKIGEDMVHINMHDAVQHCRGLMVDSSHKFIEEEL